MKVITFGRSDENDVVINDPYVTRHQFQIVQHDDGHFSLIDFGSENGTFVNEQKISAEIPLNETDIVRVGNTTVPWRMYFQDNDQIKRDSSSSCSEIDNNSNSYNSQSGNSTSTQETADVENNFSR